MVAIPKPDSVRIVVDDGPAATAAGYRESAGAPPRFVVERRWFAFTPDLVFSAIFALLWNGAIALAFFNASSTRAADAGPDGTDVIGILVLLAFVMTGVITGYRTLAGFVNKTRIAIEGGVLSVRHGPLPWARARRVAVSDVKQLFCREVLHGRSRGVRRRRRTYDLCAVLEEGSDAPLLRGLPEPEEAQYLEQLLEEKLAIVPAPVAGEYAGSR